VQVSTEEHARLRGNLTMLRHCKGSAECSSAKAIVPSLA
jgi:hypothetical protein